MGKWQFTVWCFLQVQIITKNGLVLGRIAEDLRVKIKRASGLNANAPSFFPRGCTRRSAYLADHGWNFGSLLRWAHHVSKNWNSDKSSNYPRFEMPRVVAEGSGYLIVDKPAGWVTLIADV